MRGMRTAIAACCALSMAAAASAQEHGWHALQVPGGRATLRALGVDDSRERAAVMIEIIRRLHFSTTAPLELEAALRRIPTRGGDGIALPLPIPRSVWEHAVFERTVPESQLFAAILNDPLARLLFHGLAGVDAATRRWFESEPGIVRALYRNSDAAKAFALFAPALVIKDGRIIVAGGERAAGQWSAVLGASANEPRSFVSRLFLDRHGRAAGLFFLIASVEPMRQQFLLSGRLDALVESFASCYPRNSVDYPFIVRAKDPALLLLNVGLTDARLAGPRSRRFWESVLDVDDLLSPAAADGPDAIDAVWLVDRLCAASSVDRTAVFATILAGHRLFGGLPPSQLAEASVALRVRRLYPALFMAMEHAGLHQPGAVVAIGRHAESLARLNDPESTPVTLQQFQGAVAILLAAAEAQTLTLPQARQLLGMLSLLPIRDGRYNGRLAAFVDRELLPALRAAVPSARDMTSEEIVARAIAGPAPVRPLRIEWEGLSYIVDHATTARDRILEVREKQRGATLDRALQLARNAAGAGAVRAADAILGQVLASWAYAPHVGEANDGALLGGDASRRHDLGIRAVNRTRFEQRWELALTTGDRGSIAGSYLGLDAALATWSLRRLSADTIPLPPTLGDNDRSSLLAIVSLADPRRLTDAGMHRIAEAVAAGTRTIESARSDPARLDDLAARAAISPWRRHAIGWMIDAEPARIAEQFPLTARLRISGVAIDGLAAWGTSAIPYGCLCLVWADGYAPELIAGRPVDGIVGAQSADLMLRVAQLLTELKMPAQLAPAVLAYAMRDYIDGVRPMHPADADAFARQAERLTRVAVEDYLGAIAAVGPLRPVLQ